MFSSRRELRACRWIEASLQNVYDDHRRDAKNNLSIYPDFQTTLYEVVGLSRASQSRKLVCLLELCRLLDVDMSDDEPNLRQEDKIRMLSERLCKRLRPSFVGKHVRKNVRRFPLRVLKTAIHILGAVAIHALDDEWWNIKHGEGFIWNKLPLHIQTLIQSMGKRLSNWGAQNVHQKRLLHKLDRQIVNRCIFHLFIDYTVEGIVTSTATASHNLHEWTKPKRQRTLARDTIAKILYTVRKEIGPPMTAKRAIGGSSGSTTTVTSWTTFKNTVSGTFKRMTRFVRSKHTKKRSPHETAETLRLRSELEACMKNTKSCTSATGTYMYLSGLLVATLMLIAARMARLGEIHHTSDSSALGHGSFHTRTHQSDDGQGKQPGHHSHRVRKTGYVKNYFQDRGYGFIIQDDGERELYVHAKDVSGQTLSQGIHVTYEVGQNKKGPCAVKVQGDFTKPSVIVNRRTKASGKSPHASNGVSNDMGGVGWMIMRNEPPYEDWGCVERGDHEKWHFYDVTHKRDWFARKKNKDIKWRWSRPCTPPQRSTKSVTHDSSHTKKHATRKRQRHPSSHTRSQHTKTPPSSVSDKSPHASNEASNKEGGVGWMIKSTKPPYEEWGCVDGENKKKTRWQYYDKNDPTTRNSANKKKEGESWKWGDKCTPPKSPPKGPKGPQKA